MANDPPLRILIVDDETPARRRLAELLADAASGQESRIVGEAANGLQALALLERDPVDVILLDIRMPEMDGIELAQHLAKLPNPPAVVFATAYDDYAVKAFELNAVDYLLKPIRLERLLAALRKARSLVPRDTQALAEVFSRPRAHLSVCERGKIILVPVEDIIYLKAELKYVTARTAAHAFLLEESLTRLEHEYAGRFLRIHRSCLVAKDHVAGFEKTTGASGSEEGEPQAGWMVLLKNLDERLPVSRRQQHIIKELSAKVEDTK